MSSLFIVLFFALNLLSFNFPAWAVSPSLERQADDDIIVYDSAGKPSYYARADWEKDVLPGAFKTAWNNPDQLYTTIANALADDFVSLCLKPSARLLEIDTDKPRSVSLRSVVLMRNGKFSEAEKFLAGYLAKHLPTGELVTNLAKARYESGKKAEAEAALAAALKIEPNYEDALLWWLDLQRAKGGEAGYKAALEQLAARKGSWRAKLFLARSLLETKNIAEALGLYRQVLDTALIDSDALLTMSGDLGSYGYSGQIVHLIEPVYDPETHGIETGLNLLHAYAETNHKNEGKRLLARIRKLKRFDTEERLKYFDQAFG